MTSWKCEGRGGDVMTPDDPVPALADCDDATWAPFGSDGEWTIVCAPLPENTELRAYVSRDWYVRNPTSLRMRWSLVLATTREGITS